MTASTPFIVAVVDDDQRVLESLEDLLESAGHCVRLFLSAQALLENDGLAAIDCLISDIGMPVMDGLELQRVARAARPELPVILITGRHEKAHYQRAVAQDKHDLFEKPFNGQDLLAAVGKALQASSRGR
jgi:FixJ family two-component response regulator